MNREGEKINENQLNEIRAIAEQYDIGTCLQCAAAIKAYLKAQKIQGRHIRIETSSPHGLMGIIYDDGTNQQIATNGYREAIVIEIEGVETVFDNLYSEGKTREKWIQDLVVILGNQLNFIRIELF